MYRASSAAASSEGSIRSSVKSLIEAVFAAVVLAIYLATLAPTTAFWDTSEYIASAYVLGIPHPPGNPLFNVMAHVFGALPLGSSYAVRINLFAAVTSGLSAKRSSRPSRAITPPRRRSSLPLARR